MEKIKLVDEHSKCCICEKKLEEETIIYRDDDDGDFCEDCLDVDVCDICGDLCPREELFFDGYENICIGCGEAATDRQDLWRYTDKLIL